MISVTNLSMRFGGKILFKNVNFQLNSGQHYGLVGANGAGKSTLIKILIEEITPESGEITIPTLLKLGSLKQDHFIYENERILDIVLMGKPALWKAMQQKELLLTKDHFTEEECHLLAEIDHVIEKHHGYTAANQAAKLLVGLGIKTEQHEKALTHLSGGYKLRVLLAQVLFSEPDILLLDEPTNHLDIFSIRWLEGYLKDFPGTLLISSHDWDFLNGTCQNIIDLDYGTIKIYKGNYDDFLETKATNQELQANMLANQSKKIEGLQEFIDRFKAKATKAKQAQSKMRLVAKLENEMSEHALIPSSRMFPNIQFDQVRPAGIIALTVEGIHKNYGPKKVLSNVSFQVERGERLAFLGANGIGKSTLLEILTQHTRADSGKFEWGFATQIAYFPQDHHREVNGTMALLDWLSQYDRQVPEQKLREILARALFSGDDVKKTVNVLSGGETARLILAKMMLLKHNVLIFDEPTNHLDMEATEALLEALQDYPGTLIFVSHNRHFVSHIANRIIELSPEGATDFKCNYSEYLVKREIDLLSATSPKTQKKDIPSQGKEFHQEQKLQKNRKTQLEKKLAQAEKKCQEIEEQIKKVEDQLSAEGFYTTQSLEKQREILSHKERLDIELEHILVEWEKIGHELTSL